MEDAAGENRRAGPLPFDLLPGPFLLSPVATFLDQGLEALRAGWLAGSSVEGQGGMTSNKKRLPHSSVQASPRK